MASRSVIPPLSDEARAAILNASNVRRKNGLEPINRSINQSNFQTNHQDTIYSPSGSPRMFRVTSAEAIDPSSNNLSIDEQLQASREVRQSIMNRMQQSVPIVDQSNTLSINQSITGGINQPFIDPTDFLTQADTLNNTSKQTNDLNNQFSSTATRRFHDESQLVNQTTSPLPILSFNQPITQSVKSLTFVQDRKTGKFVAVTQPNSQPQRSGYSQFSHLNGDTNDQSNNCKHERQVSMNTKHRLSLSSWQIIVDATEF